MAEEIKETPKIEEIKLTKEEQQAIEQQRVINAKIIACKTAIDKILIDSNCYLAINGQVQVAGNVASPQLRIDVMAK